MAKRTIKAPIIMRLKSNERKELKKLVTKGSAKAREIRRANILLMSDKKKTPKEILLMRRLSLRLCVIMC